MILKFEHFITSTLICTWLCYKNLNVFAMTYICCTCMYSSRYILTLFILLYFFLTNVLRIRINQIILYRQNTVPDYNDKIFENNIKKLKFSCWLLLCRYTMKEWARSDQQSWRFSGRSKSTPGNTRTGNTSCIWCRPRYGHTKGSLWIIICLL